MKSLSSITLTGSVGADPKTPLASNPDFVTFSLAIGGSIKNSSGEYEPKTDWYNCFSAQKIIADQIKDLVKKGSKVTLIGTPRQKSYLAKDGKEKFSVEVQIEKIAVMNYSDSYANGAYAPPAEIAAHFQKPKVLNKEFSPLGLLPRSPAILEGESDDEIPF